MVALSASALLPVLRPPAAWAAAPQLGGGGNGAPPSGGVGGGGGGSGGGGGDGWQLARRPPQEAFQVAAANKPILLTLVSFAVTRKAYGKITKLFNRDYEAATGRTVRFRLSFGGSGSQARAVIDGMPADVVALALPLDIIKIAEAGASVPLKATPSVAAQPVPKSPLLSALCARLLCVHLLAGLFTSTRSGLPGAVPQALCGTTGPNSSLMTAWWLSRCVPLWCARATPRTSGAGMTWVSHAQHAAAAAVLLLNPSSL